MCKYVILLSYLYDILFTAQSNFTVQPVSVIQAEGLMAVFECFHPEGRSSYDWAINGTFLSVFPSGIVAVSPSVNSPVASLTIPASQNYSSIVVQCRTIVEGESNLDALSNIATLTVYG